MIDLSKLQSFIHVAETLSFSKTAKILGVSQPTISHHIKSLEFDLGLQLFDRSGHTIQLTENARILIPWARKLISQSIELQNLMASTNEKIVGHLRIACSTTAGKYVLPRLAARFRQQHPGIQISILKCMPENIVPRLLEGEANLGVVSYETGGNGLEIQKFFQDYISLIVPAGHPWASREFIEPDEILEEPLIIREETSGTRRVLLSELAKHDISLDELNVFLELGNAEAAVETVAAGFSVTFVSRLATVCPMRYKQVVEVPVAGLDLQRTIYMVRRGIDSPNRAQEVFWSFIHKPSNADLLHLAEAPRN